MWMSGSTSAGVPIASRKLWFCCNQCGRGDACRHKGDLAQMIWCMPQDRRTANELMTASSEEREKVWADMIAEPQSTRYKINPEEPAFIEQCLAELNEELDKSMTSTTSGGSDSVNGNVEGINITPYEQAYRTSPEYVTSRSFQLSFLRADRFDPKAAAQRIRLHFETKKELFCSGGSGEADSNIDILGRDVTLDDLTDEERKCYSTSNDGSGHFMRFLDGRDMAGRPILFGRTARLNFENLFSERRIVFVKLNAAAKENEDLQRLGFVNICHMLDEYPTPGDNINPIRILQQRKSSTRQRPREPGPTTQAVNFDSMAKLVNLSKSIPLRCVAMYFLADSGNGWNKLIDFAMIVFGRMLRMRCRVIYGSKQECKYNLMCLGFAPTSMPKELEDEDDDDLGGNNNKKRKTRIVKVTDP